jgi:hypothetical protein
MKKDKTVTAIRIGDTVATLNYELQNRFKRISLLRYEAQNILTICAEEDRQLWKDVGKEYSLDVVAKRYKVKNETGDVVFIGYQWLEPSQDVR